MTNHVVFMGYAMRLVVVNAIKAGKIRLVARRYVLITAAAMAHAPKIICASVMKATKRLSANAKFV